MKPSFSPGLDIRASIIPASSNAEKPVSHPRGTGKLLSSTQGVGLALLRLEHAEGAQQGDVALGFDFEEGEESDGREKVKRSWNVTPWWPDWWPTKPEEF